MNFREILSDAGVSFFRKLVTIGSGFVIIPIITRKLGAEEYGIWVTLISFVGLMTTVSGLHLHGALIRYSQRERDEEIFINIFTLSSIVSVGTVVTILILSIVIGRAGLLESISFNHLIPVGILIGLRIIIELVLNSLRARKRIKHYELAYTIRLLLETSAIAVAVWYAQSLVTALWALVGVTLLLDILLLAILLPRPVPRPNPSSFKRYLSYGIPMIPKEISGSLLNHADKFLIIYFLGPVATGVYAVAYTVTTTFPAVTGIFNSTLYPRVSEAWDNKDFNDLRKFYSVFIRWYIILILPAIAGVSILATPLLQLISTGEIATEAAVLVPILAAAFAFQGLEYSLSYPLAAGEETKKIAVITVIAVVVNIGANVALIPTLGLSGAAIATFFAFALRTGCLYHYSNQFFDIALPVIGGLKSGISTIIMILSLIWIPIEHSAAQLVAFPIIGAVVFFITFILLGGVHSSEWNRLRSLINISGIGLS